MQFLLSEKGQKRVNYVAKILSPLVWPVSSTADDSPTSLKAV